MQNNPVLSLAKSTTVLSVKAAAGGWWLSTLARISPQHAGRSALRLFGTPPSPRPVSRGAAAVLGRARRFAIERDGATVRAYAWGSGPTVYLVHGWGGRASQLTSFVDPLLERGLRVVCFDAPAHGASGGTHTTLFDFASTLRALVAVDGGSPHAFVGHSLGAAAAILAAAGGDVPKRLALVAPPSDPARYVGYFVEQLGATPDVGMALRRALVERYALDGGALTLTDQADRVHSPMLVVHDHDDAEIPWRHGAALARAWWGARLWSSHGLGHHRLLRDPGVVSAITEFLSVPESSGSSAPTIGEPPPEVIDGICATRSCTRPALDDGLCLEHLLSYESAHPHTRYAYRSNHTMSRAA